MAAAAPIIAPTLPATGRIAGIEITPRRLHFDPPFNASWDTRLGRGNHGLSMEIGCDMPQVSCFGHNSTLAKAGWGEGPEPQGVGHVGLCGAAGR